MHSVGALERPQKKPSHQYAPIAERNPAAAGIPQPVGVDRVARFLNQHSEVAKGELNLEWSLERVAGSSGLEASGPVYHWAQKAAEFFAVLPDYTFRGSESWFGATFAGVAGVLISAAALAALALLVCRKRKKAAAV